VRSDGCTDGDARADAFANANSSADIFFGAHGVVLATRRGRFHDGRRIESFALPAGSEKPGACGDSGPADGAETPPSSPGDGESSDGAAHAAATSVLVGLVAAFAV